MDTYSAVKTEILSQSGVETLWSQSREIWKRRRDVMRGIRMSLADVLSVLDPTDLQEDDESEEEEILTVQALQQKIPKMKEFQAIELLTEACNLSDFHDDQ